MKIVFFFLFFFSMPKQCAGIPAQKITLAHKCMVSDVIWHKSIFSLVTSSPGGSHMSDQVKTRKSVHRTRMPPPNAIQKKGLYVTVTGIQ